MRVMDMTAEGAATPATRMPASTPNPDSLAPVRGQGEISELSETACMILISASTVGRLSFASTAGPELVPVNFVFDDGVIYFLSDPNGFLARCKRGRVAVAFGVDSYADANQGGWDVTIKGTASRAGERAARRTLLRLRPTVGDRPTVMQIQVISRVGRRVSGG
jgi:nitroimidazol reductase NimA-like FMN-containing flavoprotein (pyridoxamine 5'-phosphate oxidase superfamily)